MLRTCVRMARTDSVARRNLMLASAVAAPLAIRALPAADPRYRLELTDLLGAIAARTPTDSIRDALISSVGDASPAVRASAILGLRRFSQPAVRLAVQKRAAMDDAPAVQRAVAQWFIDHGGWQQVFDQFGESTSVAPTLNETLTKTGRDSLAAGRAQMLSRVRDLLEERAQIAARLRPDSGTARADSVFTAWRTSYLHRGAFADSSVTALVTGRDGPLRGALSDSLRGYIEGLGFHVVDGEGEGFLIPSESPFIGEAERFLTPPMQRFLRVSAIASDQMLGGDGSVSLDWEEVGERLAAFEALAGVQPPIAAHAEAVEEAARYRSIFFNGTDNTRLFEDGPMPKTYRRAFRDFAARHPNTPSGALAREFVRLLEASRYRPNKAIQDLQRRTRAHQE